MKRISAILLCLSLMLVSLCSTAVFAEDGNNESDLHDGLIFPEEEALTVSAKKALINSAPIEPIVTHYQPLDDIVSQVLSQIITPEMDSYRKVVAIFNYLRKGTEYAYDYESNDEIASAIMNSVYYKNSRDYNIVSYAYRMLTEKSGKCEHFSAAFLVLTRAVGLESYLASSTNSSTGLGSHISSMMKIGDELYYFDPVMGVVMGNSGDITDSCYFCYPMQNSRTSEYSYLKEQLNCFGKFELQNKPAIILANRPKGKTPGDKHFTLGSYPQTRVTDAELINALNEQLTGVTMNEYPYSYGSGTYDSMIKSSYMSWADITYGSEKYRAVKIDDYRPKIIYLNQSKEYSMQNVTGYTPGSVYWFRFEPIEWRLTDETSLLVADIALDAQPFNDELHLCEEGKILGGRRYYVFRDERFTIPANDWEASYIREWLNNDFYNTAFTAAEKRLILDTQLDPNYGVNNFFDYASTTDKVFLLSKDELLRSEYHFRDSSADRIAASSDYAQSQGAVSRHTKKYGTGTSWLLRNPGLHSEDVNVVDNKGTVHPAVSAGCASSAIRPAIRVSPLIALMPDTLSTPSHLTAKATETGQITLKSAVCNGADYYKFYCYSGNSAVPERVITADGPRLVINDLTPGKAYRFSVSAVRESATPTHAGVEETALTEETTEKCKTFVEAPESFTSETSGTGRIRIKVDPVKGASAYNIYRIIDADTTELCGTTENNELELDGFTFGWTYMFRVSSLSDDGYESELSDAKTKCYSDCIPPRPANVTATPAATDKISVSWDKSEGADHYNVFRYKGDGYIYIGTTSVNSYTDSELHTNNLYTYKIQAVTADEKDVSVLSISARCKCTSIPPAPEDLVATPTKTGELTLSWSAVDTADLYRVEIYDSASGDYKELGVTYETSYTASGLKAGLAYSFLVSAETADGKNKSAKTRTRDMCQSIPAVPEGLTAQVANIPNTVTLSWNAVPDATGYYVYKLDRDKDDFIYAAETTKDHIDINGVSNSSTSTFKVAAVKRGKNVTDVSALSKQVMIRADRIAAPAGLTAAATATGEVTLKWDPVKYAERYDIYLFDSATGQYIPIGSTDKTSFAAGDLKLNALHIFRVYAVNIDGSDEFASEASEKISCKALSGPDPVGNLKTEIKDDSVKLTWSPSSGAVRYYIYRENITEKTPPERIGSTTGTAFTAGQLKAGTSYKFYVAAASETNGSTILSSPSKVLTVRMPGGETQPPTETEAAYLLGDADSNGNVDSTDAAVIQRHLIGIDQKIPLETLMHGDTDGDGELTVVDATFILRYCVQAEIPYPIGKPAKTK